MQREPVGDVWETLELPGREDLVAGFAEAERVLRPHERWHYSNLMYALLGEVIARLDEQEWCDALRRRILDPLELRRTTLGFEGARSKATSCRRTPTYPFLSRCRTPRGPLAASY
jgi:CubicO group peptidase (beta-lactamase class C family)